MNKFRYILTLSLVLLMSAGCSPFSSSTTLGLVKTDNGGNDWLFVNTLEGENAGNLNGLRFSTISFDPNSSEMIYAGSYDGGLYKSENSGASWKRILSKINVYDHVVNKFNTNQIFVGGFFAEHGKVLSSDDGGRSWVERYNEESTGNAVRALALNPSNPSELIIGMTSGAINRSTDGGITWKAMLTFSDKINQINWTNDGLYILVRSKGLYLSTDSGQNFQNVTAPLLPTVSGFDSIINRKPINEFNHFALSKTNKNTIYTTTDSGLFKTTDGGVNWQDLKLPLTSNSQGDIPIRAVSLSSLNDAFAYVSAGATIYKTQNGGDTWQTQSIVTTGFINSLAVNPNSPQIVYGGIYENISGF